MKLLFCAIVTAVALASLAIAQQFTFAAVSGSVPVEISVVGGMVGAGEKVTYRVTMDDICDRGQTVFISSSSGSAYDEIPASVWVEPGNDEVEFEAMISMDPPSAWNAYASANSQTVSCPHALPSAK